MDIVALALAKKHTNETALGQGAVQIPGPPGPNLISPATQVQGIQDGKLLGVEAGKIIPAEPSNNTGSVGYIPLTNVQILNIINNS